MFLEESQAKTLLAGFGVKIPNGRSAHTPTEASQIAANLARPVMVKAQVLAGKRGKGGGIIAAATPVAAETAASQILGSTLNGYLVEEVLVEAKATIAKELYAAITLDPTNKCPLLIFSTAGGMDIEEVHATTPEQVLMQPLDIRVGLDEETAVSLLANTLLAAQHQPAIAKTLAQLYTMYRRLDAQLVEINPLAITQNGEIIALDCKLVIDDSSLSRQKNLPAPKPQGTALERAAREENFLFIELDGDVGVLANGAGLTMTTMDTVAHFGGNPANFMEVGGDAYKRAKPALSLVLQNSKIKSLLVNLCGAYARTDVIIEGILGAWQELKPDLPLSFCIHGTGEKRAQQLVRDTLNIEPYEHMNDAVQAAIAMAKDTAFATPGSSTTLEKTSRITHHASRITRSVPRNHASPRRLLVQGITGSEGAHWTGKMLEYGTQVVAGVTPGKGGQTVNGLPVYNSVAEAVANHDINMTVLFVPPRFIKSAALEAIDAGIQETVILTEHIPLQDVMTVFAAAKEKGLRIFGPNSPGLVFPGRDFVGIMPGWAENLFQPGRIGVVSRSGSLGALICLHLVEAGFGQSAFYGIGGDPIVGTTFRDALEIFEQDEQTEAVVMLGEIGGPMEAAAAKYIPQMTKPVVTFIAGQSAPVGKKMGHAGAMVAGGDDNAVAKKAMLREAGAHVADVPSQVTELLANLLKP